MRSPKVQLLSLYSAAAAIVAAAAAGSASAHAAAGEENDEDDDYPKAAVAVIVSAEHNFFPFSALKIFRSPMSLCSMRQARFHLLHRGAGANPV